MLDDQQLNSLMIQKQKQTEPYTLAPNATLSAPVVRLMAAKRQGYCRIANYRWIELNMAKACKSVLKWSVKNLDAESNDCPHIIEEISSISFTRLIIINLSSNLIFSIENLSKINSRNLEDLNLSNNKITSLEGLRRLHTFRLRKLNVCSNPFSEISCLSEMPLMNLEVLVLQNEAVKARFIHLWDLLKLETDHLKSLYIRQWDRTYKAMGRNELTIIRNRFFELSPGRNI